jgi:BASS family bile acid:Na+ symporter
MKEWFQISAVALKISIVVQVFAMGLIATWRDATYLFRQPAMLWRSILARNLVAPSIAVLVIKAFALPPAASLTLAALSVTPVPPLLAKGRFKVGAATEYAVGLLVSQSVLAVVLVPPTVLLLDLALGAHARFSGGKVALLVTQSVLAPLFAGMLASRFYPQLRHIAQILLAVGSIVLISAAIPLLLVLGRTFGALAGGGTIPAFAIFLIAGKAAGHLLGGPVEANRTTLALATSSRHPAVAIAIAAANFPSQTKPVAAAVAIYILLREVLCIPYERWRRYTQPQILFEKAT